MIDPASAQLRQLFSADPADPLPLPADPSERDTLFATALTAIEAALDANQVAEADQVVALAWRMADQSGSAEDLARAHWCSGLAVLNRTHAAALEHYRAARSFFDTQGSPADSARVLLGFGMAAGFLGRLDEAEAALQQAAQRLAPLPDHPHWMRLYLNLSLVLGLRGRYAEMREVALQAANAAARQEHRLIRASALVNQGMAAMALGALDEAEQVLQQARELAGEAAEVSGRALVNLARLALYRGRLFAALQLLDQAAARFAAVDLEIDRATVAIEAAGLYERLHLPHEARRQAVFAAETFAQAGLPPESVEARLAAIRLALARGRSSEARRHLAAARELQAHVSPAWQALLQGYAAHPALLHRPADAPAALARLDAAIASLAALGALAEQLDLALPAAELLARSDKAAALARYRQIADAAGQYDLPALEQRACLGQAALLRPSAAIEPLRRAAALFAAQRRQMPVEELKARLLSGGQAIYTRLIETQLKVRRQQAAFADLLVAKGSAWVELSAPAPLQQPDAAWLSARADLLTWQEERRFAGSADYRELCEQRIQAAEAALTQAARRQIRLREPQALPSVEQIQAGLKPGRALIDCLVGSTHLHACLLLPQQGPQWLRLGKVASIQHLMGRFSLLLKSLQAVATPEQRLAAAAAQQPLMDDLLAELYAQVLAPLQSLLPVAGELLIAPDSFLFELPWAALRMPQAYLGECYRLLLLPSASVPGLVQESAEPTGSPLALGYAGDPPLLHIEAELAALQRALPNLDVRKPARLADLDFDLAPDILHIAAHGHIRRDAPLLSQLQLADGGFLLAEALRLNLRGCRLVTLSACDTGTLPEHGGVLLALAGSFLLAGARQVLASLWPVDDAATTVLMAEFYAAAQQGAGFPAALQQAQLALRDQGFAQPMYWAAFQLLARAGL
jgi:CHAT domain-containing protein